MQHTKPFILINHTTHTHNCFPNVLNFVNFGAFLIWVGHSNIEYVSFTLQTVKKYALLDLHTSLNVPKTNCQVSVHQLRRQHSWKQSIYLQKLFGVLWEWHCILNAECLWPCNGVCSPMSGLRVLCPSVWALQWPTGNDMTPWRQPARTAAHTRTTACTNVINLVCSCRTAFWRRWASTRSWM